MQLSICPNYKWDINTLIQDRALRVHGCSEVNWHRAHRTSTYLSLLQANPWPWFISLPNEAAE
jgi:hypothetical protein